MMFKLAEEDKRVLQGPKNQVYSNLFHLFQSPAVSSRVSFSNGFCSSEEGSPYAAATPLEEPKYQAPPPYMNNRDDYDLGLARSLYRMHIRDERRGFEGGPVGDFGVGFENHGLFESSRNYNKNYNNNNNNNVSGFEGFQSPGYGVSGRFDGVAESALLGLQPRCDFGDPVGSFVNPTLPNNNSALFSGSSGVKNQISCYQRNPSVGRPYLDEDYFLLHLRGTDCNAGKGIMYPPMGSPQFPPVAQLNVESFSHNDSMIKQRTKVNTASRVPDSFVSMKCGGELEGCCSVEESFIMEGKHTNHAIGEGGRSSKGYKKNSCNKLAMQTEGKKGSRLASSLCSGGIGGNERSQSDNSTTRSLPYIGSLDEVQGYIYSIAKDQYGCRFLQRMLDEGTCQDVQLIFDRIINHVFELMTNPFGNYLMQKLLDVCNEQQRMQFVLKVTKEPGQLVRISLDTHGTRVVQKLIETVKIGKQISLVKSSLEYGFLDLIKDSNGNHVVQRCLDCFSNEDNRFIFDAAARFCVEIATQRHGCCVLQKCIGHAIGRHRDKLINEITRNGLLLSQDPYGNYVVQFVLELKIPSVMAKLINQLKGHFVRLSTQKCSSHVVERCLLYFEESRSKIIRELLSVPRFEQLLQDPYANYVIHSALTVTKGPLHASLVEAVKPHTMLRTSPYCKRIFSRELLKK